MRRMVIFIVLCCLYGLSLYAEGGYAYIRDISYRQPSPEDAYADSLCRLDVACPKGVSDAPVRLLLLSSSQAQAHKRTAAIANQNSDGERNHCQRENHCICRIPIRPQTIGIGNENLIHNIVQSGHQQGNNTGDRIFAHQLSDRLPLQKCIRFFFHFLFSSKL